MPKIIKNCAYCGRDFEVWPSTQERRKTCSRECNTQWQRTAQAGENNGNYKHGRSVRKNTVAQRFKRKPIAKLCKGCNKEFTTLDKRQKYCDRKCYGKSNAAVWIKSECPVCGKTITYPSFKPRVTCSNKCSTTKWHMDKNHNLGSIDLFCINCWQIFTVKSYYKDAKFCSRQCADQYRTVLKKCAWCGIDVLKPQCREHYDHSFCSDVHRLSWLNGGFSAPSKPELEAIEILDELGISYEFQHPFGKYVFDFAILDRDQKIDLEIDGEYHHSLPHNTKRDRRRDWWARKNGWKVVRIPSKKVTKEYIVEQLAKVGFNMEDSLH